MLCSSSNFQLYTPKPHLEMYRNKFVFSGSSVWNLLPSYIHNSNSFQHVKAQYLRWVNPNIEDTYNAYHNTLDTMRVHMQLMIYGGSTMQ